ncbi:MAG: AsmA-like C-terminal region-containing protein [Thermodesulfobacteriota bacterium]
MRILVVFLALIILISGLVGFALLNLNGIINKNKDLILSQIEKQVGREVYVEKVGINIWRGLGLKLENFRTKDDPAYSEENFVEADELVISLKFLPLLKKEVEVKKLILKEPIIRIIKNKSGNFNFSSLVKDKPEIQKKSQIEDIVVSLVNISNGEIIYSDLAKGSALNVKKIDLKSKNISFDKPIEFDLSLSLLSENQNININGEAGPIGKIFDINSTRLDANIQIDGLNISELKKTFPEINDSLPKGLGLGNNLDLKLNASGTGGEIELKKIDLNTSVFSSGKQNLSVSGTAGPLGKEIPENKLNLELEFTIDPVLIENLKQFEPIAGAFPSDLKAQGSISITGIVNGNTENLNLLFIKLDGKSSEIDIKDKFKKGKDDILKLSTDAIVSKTSVLLKNTDLELNKLRVKGGGKIGTGKNQHIDLNIDTNSADLSSISKNILPLSEYGLSGNFQLNAALTGSIEEGKTPNINGTAKLENVGAKIKELPKPITNLNGAINFRGSSAKIDNARMKLGSSDMVLNANIKTVEPLSIDYTLTSPEIKLSDISPTAKEGETINNLSIKGYASAQNGDIRSNAAINSESGKFSKINYKNLGGNIEMKDKIINFNDLGFNFLSARLKTSGKYNMQGEMPKFSVNTNLSGLNITDLVKTFISPNSNAINGSTNLELQISGAGTEWKDIQNTLDGLGKIELTEGKLIDFNLAEEVLTGITGIKGLSGLISQNLREKYPDIFKTSSTVFYNMKTPFKIDKGKINLNNLILSASNYIVDGKGSIGLDSALNMKGVLVLSDKLSNDLINNQKYIAILKNAEGKIQIPFLLDGNLPGVKPKPDINFIAQKVQSLVIEEGKGKLKEKLLEEVIPKGENSNKTTKDQIDKVITFPKKEKNNNTEENKDDENLEKKESEEPLEKLIEKGLDSIFKQ